MFTIYRKARYYPFLINKLKTKNNKIVLIIFKFYNCIPNYFNICWNNSEHTEFAFCKLTKRIHLFSTLQLVEWDCGVLLLISLFKFHISMSSNRDLCSSFFEVETKIIIRLHCHTTAEIFLSPLPPNTSNIW